MKVQVNLKVAQKLAGDSSPFELVVDESDTVLSIKDQIASVLLLSFPARDLVFDGDTLQDDRRLVDCGVNEGSALDLLVEASEKILIEQLSELLKARDLSFDELGLLYCYKYGVSVNHATKLLGLNEKLSDFVKRAKVFTLENGRVSLIREDASLKPFSLVDEIKQMLEASTSGSMDVPALCTKFADKFNISFESIAGMRPLDFLHKERDVFVVTGRRYVSLKHATRDRPRCMQQDMAAPPGLKLMTTSDESEDEATEAAIQNQKYLDLQNQICGCSFDSKLFQALDDLVVTIQDSTFLSIHHIVTGGSISKGTAIKGCTGAEVVLFLNGLPPTGNAGWLAGLLKSVAWTLQERLEGEDDVEGVRIVDDAICLRTKRWSTLSIRISPVYDSYASTIQILDRYPRCQAVRRNISAALTEEKVRFIEKQPEPVKMTIRLMKWWREQQEWSCALNKPSDEILEILTVYSAMRTKPADQRLAVANTMSLLARFNELRIVWPGHYYSNGDIWAPLLKERPLLMDPTNPFVNIADAFDAQELMMKAQSTRFFW